LTEIKICFSSDAAGFSAHVFKFISEPTLVLAESMRNSFSLKKEVAFSGAAGDWA